MALKRNVFTVDFGAFLDRSVTLAHYQFFLEVVSKLILDATAGWSSRASIGKTLLELVSKPT